MNNTTLRTLGLVVAVLLIAWFLVESDSDGDLPGSGMLLFPDMEASLNEVTAVSVSRAGAETVRIEHRDGVWGITNRANFPARLDSIRNVLIAMAEAAVVEPKTADPARHSVLGVDDPVNELSKGALVTAVAGDREFSLIFGNVAQTTFRYARIAGEDQSWLIDQNPDIPAAISEWLEADIVDIPSTRIQSVTITHADGESIAVSKDSEDAADFSVADVPDGRELSYSTVANGIAGGLNDLDLDDVRAAIESDADVVVTEFVTFDGLTITATIASSGDKHWLTLVAASSAEASTEADEINARTSGWQFRIADYKANLLTRRWEDILKPLETEAEE